MRRQVAYLAIFLFLAYLGVSGSQTTPQPLLCIAGVSRFSKKDSVRSYYDCGTNGQPVEMECHDNFVYHMKKQKCVSREDQKKILPIDDKALGRNIQLGSMYDARTNTFFPEASFWSQVTINGNDSVEGHAFEYLRSNVNLDVTSNKRTIDKVNHFDINAHLSVDFMSGMVHVSGAAGYLKDEVTSEEEVNVEMTYSTTTHARTIPKNTAKDYREECNNPQFTHVVTSVTYGMDAVFVFKKLLQSQETEEMVTGSLEIAINNIPGTEISGSGSVNITDSDKEATEGTKLTMYGDFSPETPTPTTFEDAIRFYKDLPQLASEGGQIVEVHLTPITDVCTPEDFILNEISDGMMTEVIKMLDELEQLEIKVTGLINSKQSQKFKPLRENLNLYRNALHSYELDVKMKLIKLLPNIRGGTGNGEDDLILLLAEYTQSQFFFATSSEFLIDRNREIQAIRFLEENFPVESNIDIADYESANDVEYIFKRDFVVVLEFFILSSKDMTQSFLDGNRLDESEFWYNDVKTNGEIGSLLRGLTEFGLDNVDQEEKGYLVKVSPMKDMDPYMMSALIKGTILSNQFKLPHTPTTPIVYDLTHESFKFSILKPNEFTSGTRVFMTNMVTGDHYVEDKIFPEDAVPGSDVEILMDGLIPANIYRFAVKYLTAVGTSPPSLETSSFPILPTSVPQNMNVDEITTDSIKVSWQPPSVLATGLNLKDLTFKLDIKGENVQQSMITTEYEFTLMQPLDATNYKFDVSVVLDRELFTAEPCDSCDFNSTKLIPELDAFPTRNDVVSTSIYSLPLPPKLIPVIDSELSMTSAWLRWEQPSKLAEGSKVYHYVLEYSTMNENGTESFSGTESQLIVTNTEIEIVDLTPGSVYAFKVQIATSEGNSDFSMELIFMTKFSDEDLEHAREELFGLINGVQSDFHFHTSFCAYKDNTNENGTVVFDTLFEDNNVDGANMNLGTFTAGAAGTYKITVAMEMVSNSGQDHWLWLKINDNKLEESQVHSTYNIYATGKGTDNGSRELLENLEAGDKVALWHETNGRSGIMSVSLCVSSVQLQKNSTIYVS